LCSLLAENNLNLVFCRQDLGLALQRGYICMAGALYWYYRLYTLQQEKA
jgi:hypothetical protein